jgi:hypothetical protein
VPKISAPIVAEHRERQRGSLIAGGRSQRYRRLEHSEGDRRWTSPIVHHCVHPRFDMGEMDHCDDVRNGPAAIECRPLAAAEQRGEVRPGSYAAAIHADDE